MTRRQPLFLRYAALIMALAGTALVVSGTVEIYFSHQQHRATLTELERDKAAAAASTVSHYVDELAHQIGWVIVPAASSTAGPDLEKWRAEYLKLLRLAPAITTLRFADPHGLELLQVSRLDADRKEGRINLAGDPGFIAARAGRNYFSPIYFAEQTEPYMTIAVPNSAREGSVTLAEVNLKFIWTVVRGIRLGEHGYAYVVDAQARLVAHPDISRVLQMADLSALPQVRAAFADRLTAVSHKSIGDAVDLEGRPVFSAYAAIEPLGWFVFVEQPRAEALAPLYASLFRTAVVLFLALGLALAASLGLARKMVSPIRKLQGGAQRIGAGDLGYRIHVESGDELQQLAEQFNRMGEQLQESYASLERRIAERTRDLEAANQAKSRFLAAASHDLRQPIHALNLLAGQLRAAERAQDRKRILGEIEAGIAALGNLLDDLLDISKLDAGAVVAQPENFAISVVLDVIHAQFAPLAADKGLKFTVRKTAMRARSDPVLLQRILLNFVSNAVRYTSRGGVLVGCRRRGSQVQIGVWDTGSGIPESRREEIFQEFVQLDAVDRDRGKGLGLGLAIVARLAPLLGTSVELNSRLGRGSRFAIGVPFAGISADGETASLCPLEERTLEAPLLGAFAIIVDDDKAAVAGLKRLLDAWGCLTLMATDAAEALALLAQHDRAPDIAICDYHLDSGKNGIEAIREIRRLSGCAVPAILITADPSSEVMQSAKAHDVVLLPKPVAPSKLRTLLQRMLPKTPRFEEWSDCRKVV